MIFAAKNRSNCLNIPDLTSEQESDRQHIIAHVEKLTHLYGRVTTSEETESYLQDWWNRQQTEVVNRNEKLRHYRARKNIHMRKMAMAVHFGESTDMVVSLEAHKKAIEMLEHIELTMHHALTHGTANPLYQVGNKVLLFLEDYGAATDKELLVKFWEQLPGASMKQMQDLLTHMIVMGKITTTEGKNAKGNSVTKYTVVKEII
jgi:hypothetical protein